MRFEIHYTVGDEDDYVIVSGKTIEEIREQADRAVALRGGKDPWSVQLDKEHP